MIHAVETVLPHQGPAIPKGPCSAVVMVAKVLAARDKLNTSIKRDFKEEDILPIEEAYFEAHGAVWDAKVETLADAEAALEFIRADVKENGYWDDHEKLYQAAWQHLALHSHGSRALELIAQVPNDRADYLFLRDQRDFALASVPEALAGLARECAEYQALMTIHLSLEQARDCSFFHFDGVKLESRRNRILRAPVVSIDDAMAKLQAIETIRKGPYTGDDVYEALQVVTAFLRDQAASLQQRAA